MDRRLYAELGVGVWVGNANNEAMTDVTEVSGAGPIWHQAIRSFLAGEPDSPFVQPPGLVQCLTSEDGD